MATEKGTALVTGASSGIGRETAVRLAEQGYKVIAAARRMDRLNALAEQAKGILPKKVDLADPEDVNNFSKYIAEQPRAVSVLINNAGYSIRGALEDVDMDAARRIFEVNFFSLIQVTKACLPGMRKQRQGTIVNLSSIVGKFPFPMSGVYSASKYAVEAITDALRLELAPFGIRVVAIRPGVIATEFNEVANAMTGDVMSRTDPDYKTLYETAGAGVGKMFAGVTVPGPELIADLIMEAVLSDNPKTVYAAGPFVEDVLGERMKLDDDKFYGFWMKKTGLAGFKVE